MEHNLEIDEEVVLPNVLLRKSNNIATIIINRPKALNALNWDTLLDLKTAVENVQDDNNIYVIVIKGAGEKSFVAGADITFMQNMTALEGRKFGLFGSGVCRLIELIEKPVIAAINGFCLGGGCELAMCCDIRICSEKSKFGQPEVSLGVIPGFGGTQRLPRLIGTAKAKQLLYTGETIGADEAYRIGLVNKVVSEDHLMDCVMEMASIIASKGQRAVNLCKAAVNQGMQTDIDRGLEIETDMFALCFSMDDQKEGMKAFVEKRKPNFSGE